jgi:hypothetical protein
MKVSRPIDARLEYGQTNSGEKYADLLSIDPRAVRWQVREAEDRRQ